MSHKNRNLYCPQDKWDAMDIEAMNGLIHCLNEPTRDRKELLEWMSFYGDWLHRIMDVMRDAAIAEMKAKK